MPAQHGSLIQRAVIQVVLLWTASTGGAVAGELEAPVHLGGRVDADAAGDGDVASINPAGAFL